MLPFCYAFSLVCQICGFTGNTKSKCLLPVELDVEWMLSLTWYFPCAYRCFCYDGSDSVVQVMEFLPPDLYFGYVFNYCLYHIVSLVPVCVSLLAFALLLVRS